MSESWLVIETSARVGRLGLARGGAVVRAAALDETRRHARDLAATAGRLLAEEELTPRDLTGVMVGVGPGSYTGLRVGVMSAKALAYATGCKLIAVPTFAAIAEQAPAGAGRVWVIADAFQGAAYLQRFEHRSGDWRAADELRIEQIDESLPWLAGGAWVSGPGVAVHEKSIPLDVLRIPDADRLPRVESVYRVGLRLPPATREELFRLEPLYLRDSSAEEKVKRERRSFSNPSGG